MTTQDNITHKVGYQPMIDRITAGLALLTGGGSDVVMQPIRQLLNRQIKQLQEVLLEEMRSGHIDERAVIKEDHLVAFVLRVGRAALEGAARRKLKIMARYFFRNGGLSDYSSEAASEFFDITAQLTDADMRFLALLKRRREEGYFGRELSAEDEVFRHAIYKMDYAESYPDFRSFDEAAFALGRFGLIYTGSTLDTGGVHITKRGLDYIDSLDLDCIEQQH